MHKDEFDIPDFVRELSKKEQNKWYSDWLMDKELLKPILHYAIIDVYIYFPKKTSVLKKTYTSQQIQELDRVYSILLSRKVLLPIRWKNLPDLFREMGYLDTAVFTVFAKDYSRFYWEDQQSTTIINPRQFIQAQSN